jgi:hypothetical protein
MEKRLLLLVVALACLSVTALGCASAGKNMVTAYQVSGTTIEAAHQAVASACAAGTITAENCAKFGVEYNKVRAGYIAVGSALEVYINAEDAAAKKTSLAAYEEAIASLSTLTADLLKFVAALGVEVKA